VLYCTVLYCTVLYCTVLYFTVLYCTVFTVLYCINSIVLYCTLTSYTVLHINSTVLYRTVLYCTALYCISTLQYCSACTVPIIRLLLTSLCLAGTVCHECIRLISDPLRFGPGRMCTEQNITFDRNNSDTNTRSSTFFQECKRIVHSSSLFLFSQKLQYTLIIYKDMVTFVFSLVCSIDVSKLVINLNRLFFTL